jgi:hypothetical protein
VQTPWGRQGGGAGGLTAEVRVDLEDPTAGREVVEVGDGDVGDVGAERNRRHDEESQHQIFVVVELRF